MKEIIGMYQLSQGEHVALVTPVKISLMKWEVALEEFSQEMRDALLSYVECQVQDIQENNSSQILDLPSTFTLPTSSRDGS
jgi:hypothetical protein